MSWNNIHVDDYGWVGKLRIVQDGVAVDISSYTTRTFIFTPPDEEEVEKTATFTTTGTDGYLQYTAEAAFYDTVGVWKVRALVEKTGSELTSATLYFYVKAREG